jgi:hypothetical protein
MGIETVEGRRRRRWYAARRGVIIVLRASPNWEIEDVSSGAITVFVVT